MSGLMLQVVPPVQVRPGTWLQRFGIGPSRCARLWRSPGRGPGRRSTRPSP
ncbi:hypothetical protein P4234_00200 [Pseudomonas aeruginosa]|nr:hypothetical protein [Pseudomonas aeruginosa]